MSKKPYKFTYLYLERIFSSQNIIFAIILALSVILSIYDKISFWSSAAILCSILTISAINTFVDFNMIKSEDNLKNKTENNNYRVIRNNIELLIPKSQLKINDIIYLTKGDIIPGDGQICEGDICVDQHILTGSKNPVNKTLDGDCPHVQSDLIDFWNNHSLYEDSGVLSGKCKMRVDKVGNETVVNKYKLNQICNKQIPAERMIEKIDVKFKKLGIAMFMLSLPIFILNSFSISNEFSVFTLLNALMKAFSILILTCPMNLKSLIKVGFILKDNTLKNRNILVNDLNKINIYSKISILFSDYDSERYINSGNIKNIVFINSNDRKNIRCKKLITMNDIRDEKEADIIKEIIESEYCEVNSSEEKREIINLFRSRGIKVSYLMNSIDDINMCADVNVVFTKHTDSAMLKNYADIIINNEFDIQKTKSVFMQLESNINKFLKFRITTIISTITLALIGAITNIELTPYMLLWLSFFVDTLSAIAFMSISLSGTKCKGIKLRSKDWTQIAISALCITAIGTIFLCSNGVRYIFNSDLLMQFGFFILISFMYISLAISERVDSIDIFDNFAKNKTFFIVEGLICLLTLFLFKAVNFHLHYINFKIVHFITLILLAFIVILCVLLQKFIDKNCICD